MAVERERRVYTEVLWRDGGSFIKTVLEFLCFLFLKATDARGVGCCMYTKRLRFYSVSKNCYV